MTEPDKYHVVTADNPDAYKYHRMLIEQALKQSGLSPEFRAELEEKMKQVALRQAIEQCAQDEIGNDKKKKSKGGGTGTGDEGDGEDSASGKKGGGAGGGGGAKKEEIHDAEARESDEENLPLLLYLAEKDVQCTSDRIGIPLAAATLLFNRQERYARMYRPLMPKLEGQVYMPSAFLATLEHHAASLGARMFQVRVHAEAADMLKQKGYEPVGEPKEHKGVTLQKMKKPLPQLDP